MEAIELPLLLLLLLRLTLECLKSVQRCSFGVGSNVRCCHRVPFEEKRKCKRRRKEEEDTEKEREEIPAERAAATAKGAPLASLAAAWEARASFRASPTKEEVE